MLTHHKLDVYKKALVLSAAAESLSRSWSRRHAVAEHFRRASESVLLNIAEAARLRSAQDRVRTLDYALGSTLECAACLDITGIKGRLSQDEVLANKQAYLEITRMLIGLRKAWLPKHLGEESRGYVARGSTAQTECLFHHERLDVYQIGLRFIRWWVALPCGRELSNRLCREVDKYATSVVLNVAEGNGRYSELDHRRFLEVAAGSAVKAATYLDLYEHNVLPARLEVHPGQKLLSRVVTMLSGF